MTALAAAWVPKFVYDSSTTLEMTYPMGPPTPGSFRVAGSSGRDESASGVPSVWAGTLLHSSRWKIRGTESEWANFLIFLEWATANAGTAFTAYPDTAVPGTSHSVYLLAPTITDRIEMPALADGLLWEYEIELRRVDRAAITIVYYGLS